MMHKILKSFLFINLVLSIQITDAQTQKKVIKKAPLSYVNKKIKKPSVLAAPAVDTNSIKRVKISTSLGDIIVRLSNKTPKHRDNFIRLVNAHTYDSTLFHRVINGFMIQGGDPASKSAKPGTLLGEGSLGHTIPAEFDSALYHKKGALAAARDDNPLKASSDCQFYIVQGKTYSDSEIDLLEIKNGIHLSPAKRMTYKINGGTPFLDTKYTVFGEIESGMDVVDKIELQAVDANNRPLTDIIVKMEVLKEENN